MMNQGSRGESTPGPAVLTLVVVVGKNSLAYRLPSSRPIKIPYVCTPGWEQAGIGVSVWGHNGSPPVSSREWLSGDHGVSTLFYRVRLIISAQVTAESTTNKVRSRQPT